MKLSYDLNRMILKLAPKHSVSDHAPSTFAELSASATSGLVVWAGGSDKTIYGDASTNHAFRAWHDSLHLKLNAPFTLAGETRVALHQASLVGGDLMGNLIMAEVVGQAEHMAKTGHFPADQVKFIMEYMRGIK